MVGERRSDRAGSSVAGGSDLDGDETPDVAVGAIGRDDGDGLAGAVYVVSGVATGTLDLSLADAKLKGVEFGDEAGWTVAMPGDTDGDGHDDIVVGAPGGDGAAGANCGRIYLVLGPIRGAASLGLVAAAAIEGEEVNDLIGEVLAGAGDVNGDGNADLLAGAVNDGYSGAAYLLYGPFAGMTSLSEAGARIQGEAAGDGAGVSLAGAGDTNADGFDDILVGASGNDAGADEAGAAYLLLGGTGA